MFAEF